MVRKTLEEIGIDGSRVQMFNLSSAMAPDSRASPTR